tara:strand:+ start:549 stop:1193 length:645 start_codon:yes stop_codon:yes gene_type:complete
MSWVLHHKKYKKLVKELLYHRSELEFQEEVLKEAHINFERYQHAYAAKNNLNLQEMQHENATQIDKVLPPPKPQAVDERGLIVVNTNEEEDKDQIKQFSKVYKMIAKKIHPDKFANRMRTEEIKEKEELFKQASSGFESRDWGKMLEVAEQTNVKPFNALELCPEIKKEIKKIKIKVEKNRNTYSWKFHQCEESEECQDIVMADFFKRLFNYSA